MDKFIAKGKDALTRVILEQYGTRYVSESIYSDEDTIEELLRLVSGALIAHSWSVSQVAEAMHNFANELNYDEPWIPADDSAIVSDKGIDGRRWVKDTDGSWDDEPQCTIDDLEGDEHVKEEPLDLELDKVVTSTKNEVFGHPYPGYVSSITTDTTVKIKG